MREAVSAKLSHGSASVPLSNGNGAGYAVGLIGGTGNGPGVGTGYGVGPGVGSGVGAGDVPVTVSTVDALPSLHVIVIVVVTLGATLCDQSACFAPVQTPYSGTDDATQLLAPRQLIVE